MPSRIHHPILLLPVLVALLAVVALTAAAVHIHSDHCSQHCWLCAASFGTHALPGAPCLLLVVWVLLTLVLLRVRRRSPLCSDPLSVSRAPPF